MYNLCQIQCPVSLNSNVGNRHALSLCLNYKEYINYISSIIDVELHIIEKKNQSLNKSFISKINIRF